MATPYVLVHGASWVLPDGRVIRVPGFHTSWIASHQGIAPGATNTAEFVARTGWISAVLHEGGYLELITRSIEDQRQRDCVWRLIEANLPGLGKLILMSLSRDGVIDLSGVADRSRFEETLAAGS